MKIGVTKAVQDICAVNVQTWLNGYSKMIIETKDAALAFAGTQIW